MDLDLSQYAEEWATIAPNLNVYQHRGMKDADNLIAKMRHLAKGDGCTTIFLDNLSVVVSASGTTNDRLLTDQIMLGLVELTQETGCTVILVCHLKRPGDGDGFSHGREITDTDLRGSGMIEAFSWTIIGVERDQYSMDPCKATVRLLKCRQTGMAGEAGHLRYDRDTGRLLEEIAGFQDESNEADCEICADHGIDNCSYHGQNGSLK